MLLERLGYVGLVVGVAISVSACGSSDSPAAAPGGGGSGSGGSAGGSSACTDCVHPPAPSSTATEGDGTGQILAIRTLDLTNKEKAKTIGYDLDGKKSNTNSTDHCQLAAGAPNYIRADGNNGIDNAFGAFIMEALPEET